MQNMWISVVLIVLVIVIGLIAGARLSTPGPQRRAVYSAFATLAVLALWFFVFVAFFPADWIVPFFTVACIIIPICVYVAVARGSHNKQESEQDAQQDKQKDQKAQKKLASDKSFEIPKKDVSTEKQVKSIKQEAGKIQETPPKTAQATQVKPSKPAQAEKSEKPAQKPTEQKQPVQKPPQKPAEQKQPTQKPTEKQPDQAVAETAKPSQKQRIAQKPQAPKQESGESVAADRPMKAAAPVAAKSDTPKPKVEKAEKTTADSQIKTESKPEPAAAPLAQPATPTQSIDPKIDQTTNIQSEDIDVRVDKTVAKEINELEELVRPFGSQAVSPTEPDQGPDLHVGVPVGADTPSATTPTPTPAAAPTPPTPTADQPLAQPAPQPIKKPTKKPTPAEQFVEFHTRATALRDQGAYAIAAMLYEEAAALAPTTNDARNTQFEELACYVKANDVKKAKALAAKLRQSSVLTRFERIKLDAVERMS